MKVKCSVVIPTYFPGNIIKNLLNTIPDVEEILILDNGNDEELKNLLVQEFNNVTYLNTGDIGLGKTFNKAISIVKTNNIFITQPDVTLHKNCIENLILAKSKYKNAAILAPVLYENEKYSYYDHLDLLLNKHKKIIKRKNKNKIYCLPSGDFCVEAINSTALLVDKEKIKTINGWDDYYYTYLEDVDLCYRVRKKNYEIIKIINSKVDHVGFASHKKSNYNEANN